MAALLSSDPYPIGASDDQGCPANGIDAAVYIDALLPRLTRSGNTPVLRYGGRDTTAKDFLGVIFRYSRALAESGIGRGGLVALFASNCPNALAIRYAANLLGAAAVYLGIPPSPQQRPELLAEIDPGLLVLFPETAHLLPDGAETRVAAIGADVAGASLRLDELAAIQSGDPVASLAGMVQNPSFLGYTRRAETAGL